MTSKRTPKHFSAEGLAWLEAELAAAEADTVEAEAETFTAPEADFDDATEYVEAAAEDIAEDNKSNACESDVFESDADAALEPSTDAAVGRSAAMMSALVMVSRITGFMRTWAQAAALGVTVLASCYTVANNLPNQLYELVMGGMLATAFLPVYLSVKDRAGRKGANEYASNLTSIVMLLLGILTVVSFVFASQVIWTQAFGATSDFDFDSATWFFRFFVIEILLYALSAIFSTILNAERDYLWSTAAPIFNNVVCMASFFLYIWLSKSNPQLALIILAVGNPLGVLIQVVMQVPSLRRHGVALRFSINWHDPALRETLSIGIPTLLVTICSFVTVSVQNSSALSATAWGSSIAYYTRIWYTLPYSIFAIPITTAMFTELSSYVASDDMESYLHGVNYGTGRIFYWLVPFSLYLMVFSEPLITLMAGGSFSADQIGLTAMYLMVLATSMPFYGVATYLQKACSSLRKMYLYAAAIAAGSVLQVAFCLVLTPMFGLMMVPLSSTFFFAFIDALTFALLRHQLGAIGIRSLIASLLRSLIIGAAGAAVGAGILFACTSIMGPTGGSAFRSLLYSLLGGIPAVLVTYGLSIVLKFPESSSISSVVAKFAPSRA